MLFDLDAHAVKRACIPRSRPTKASFPELLTVLLVLRLAAGLAVGVLAGLSAATGWSGFLLYGAVGVLGVYGYAAVYLEADSDSFGQSLLTEGAQQGLALMVLTWTLLYQVTGGAK
jgi:hypothetical protein